MTSWIVGLDGSDSSTVALSWAAHMAEQRGEQVTPLVAWHVPLSITAFAGRRSIEVDRMGLRAEAELAASDPVREICDQVVEGTVGDVESVEGHAAPVLLERTGDERVVVVGRRGSGGLAHRLLGSVSQYLATNAFGPVVIVPESWAARPVRRIVVGFDGSDHSAAALRWAIEHAPAEADVVALVAIDIIPWLRPELVEERHPDEVASAKQRLLAGIEEVDPEGRARREVVLHGARQAIAEAAGDADLVVVGPRGLGLAARAILGSVTSWLLHEAPCPVAVVPGQEE